MVENVEIDGINYELGQFDFGTDLEISDKAFNIEVDSNTGKILTTTKTSIVTLLTIVNSLRAWTFKGFNEDGSLCVTPEKEILKISEENVRKLPAKHGNTLAKKAKMLNGVGEKEGKN